MNISTSAREPRATPQSHDCVAGGDGHCERPIQRWSPTSTRTERNARPSQSNHSGRACTQERERGLTLPRSESDNDVSPDSLSQLPREPRTWPQSREWAGTHRTSTSWRTRSWSPTPSGHRASTSFLLTFCFSIVSSEPRAWPQSHDSRVGGHAHRTSSTTPRHPRSHYASPSGRDTRRRPSMAMMMHVIVAKQVYKPRTAFGQTLKASFTHLAKP